MSLINNNTLVGLGISGRPAITPPPAAVAVNRDTPPRGGVTLLPFAPQPPHGRRELFDGGVPPRK